MILFLVSSSSLSLLSSTFVNVSLFSSQGTILAIPTSFVQLLQSAYAQDEDEEIEDGDEEGEDEANENGDREEEEENNEQGDSVGICCAWGERLADGILTYRIIEEVEEIEDEDEEDDEEQNSDRVNTNEDSSVSDLRNAVEEAVNDWNTKIPDLELVEASSISSDDDSDDDDVSADIEVQFVEAFGGMAAGASILRSDGDDFINEVKILLPKAILYFEHDSEIFLIQYDPQKLKEIATHEIGHALGLGHADFDSDLMSQRLKGEETENISECDVEGVLQANQWKLVNNDNTPDTPVKDQVSC